ncbi:MAG: TrkH family potassium uptake protein [Desulfobulbaceae bacterium]|nr:TrkH family potassium uptake protein [Desulfobulbaceae bacterium]
MHSGGVLNIFGKLLILLSLFLLAPIPFSLYYHDGMLAVFLLSSLVGAGLGGLLILLFVPEKDLGYRDGFAIVVLSWLGLALLGALPYSFSGQMGSFADCFFESMSGFTTTGSTILSEIEVLPPSVLFWRSLTHWLGGMGIIVLSLAILPLLGVGGMQLYQAEMPGPTKDRLAPRIEDTAKILWSVYLLITLIVILLLMLGGVGFFDAICHSFSTLATGGFSTHTASVGYFKSAYVETVIIVFMFLAGTNFALHLRAASFQVVSILTTTGFATADFDLWPPVCKIILLSLMMIGGCAGSTSGGIKVVRFLLFFKYARLQLRNLVHPKAVGAIKLGKLKVPQEVMVAILGFFALYIAFFMIATLLVTAMGVDIVTGATAVIATLNNIGPGLNLVGPAADFGHLPAAAKVLLSFCMLAGRLELYTVAVLLTPDFWAMARKPVWRRFLPAKAAG